MIEISAPAAIRLPIPEIRVTDDRWEPRIGEAVALTPTASEVRFEGLSEADLELLGERRPFGLPFEMRIELLALVESDDDTLEHFRATHSVAEQHLQSMGVPYLEERKVIKIEQGAWGRALLYDLVRLGFETGTNTAYFFPAGWTRGAIHVGPLHYHRFPWDQVSLV